MRLVVVFVAACSVWLAMSPAANAATGVRFGIQDDAWLEHGPGTLSGRVATLDRLGLDVVRVTLDFKTDLVGLTPETLNLKPATYLTP